MLRKLTLRGTALLSIIPAAALYVGCAESAKPGVATTQATDEAKSKDDDLAGRIKSEPVVFLEECLSRCRNIDTLTCTFYRQERLGIVPALRPVERLLVKWRREPLSIKFDLPDETSEYAQSYYRADEDPDKLVVLPRKGLLGLPPQPGKFPIKWSLLFHKAKNLITDFGPERMLERTLAKIAYTRKNEIQGQVILYKGIIKLDLTDQVVHHIEINNPDHPDYPHGEQDLYIDKELLIPAGVHLWNQQGELDAMYLYDDMKLNIELTDEDFKIDKPAKTTTSKPAGKGSS